MVKNKPYDFQATALEMIATGRPLVEILDNIANSTESRAEGIRCAVAFVDPELRLRPASAPSLPAGYNGALDGVPIYPYIGPCGLAAYQKEQVISENIETDDRWTDAFRSLTKGLGLKACWSTPVLDSTGNVLATFALYSLRSGIPDEHHRELIEAAVCLAGIAIERQHREERVRLYAEIISRSTEAVRIIDGSGKILEQNAAHLEMFGISDDALLGKTSSEIFGPEAFAGMHERLKESDRFHGELSATIHGQTHLIEVSLFPLKNDAGKTIYYVASNRDVTDVRKAQDELQRSHGKLEEAVEERGAQLRQLSAQLVTLQDAERRRLARELHDSVGQYLAGVKMQLSALMKSARLNDAEKKRISDSMEMIDRSSTEIRTISYLLHPPFLDELGLSSALGMYVDGFSQRSGIVVNLHIPADLGRFPDAIETTIFRVVQQSLANIHRHAQSLDSEVWIEVAAESIYVKIADTGCGISPDMLAGFYQGKRMPGVGLAGMRERVREMGGRFHVFSDQGGTVIEVSLPIPARGESAETTAETMPTRYQTASS